MTIFLDCKYSNECTISANEYTSNLANAGTVAESEAKAYKAKRPIFAAIMDETMNQSANFVGGVKVDGIMDDTTVNPKVHDPGNPKADVDGLLQLKC